MTYILQILFMAVLFNSCISMNIPLQKDTPAKGVIFQAPPSPYQLIKKKQWEGDSFWQNPDNNNSISYFSNCSQSIALIELKELQNEVLSGLKEFKVSFKQKTIHQNQKAYYLYLKKRNSRSHSMYMDIFLFKKNECFYVINLLIPTSQEKLNKEREIFKDFIKGFSAP